MQERKIAAGLINSPESSSHPLNFGFTCEWICCLFSENNPPLFLSHISDEIDGGCRNFIIRLLLSFLSRGRISADQSIIKSLNYSRFASFLTQFSLFCIFSFFYSLRHVYFRHQIGKASELVTDYNLVQR